MMRLILVSILLEPAESEGDRIGGSALDDAVDQRLYEDIDVFGDVVLDLNFLRLHLIIE